MIKCTERETETQRERQRVLLGTIQNGGSRDRVGNVPTPTCLMNENTLARASIGTPIYSLLPLCRRTHCVYVRAN